MLQMRYTRTIYVIRYTTMGQLFGIFCQKTLEGQFTHISTPPLVLVKKVITCYIMSFQVSNEINNNAKTLVSFWCRTWLLLNMRLYIPDTTGCFITKYTKSYTVLFKLGMFLRKNIILESY